MSTLVQASPAPSSCTQRAEPPSRGPGRPRVEGYDERLLDAVIEILEAGQEVTVVRVVERSGLSRATLYRRWPSLTELVAAALDRGREMPVIPLDGDLLANLLDTFLPAGALAKIGFTESRFRLRLRLALGDRGLARSYWASHVVKRRAAVAALLTEGVRRGELRPDLDVDAAIDLINGVFYYQYVVRGTGVEDPACAARCREAVTLAWAGMRARG